MQTMKTFKFFFLFNILTLFTLVSCATKQEIKQRIINPAFVLKPSWYLGEERFQATEANEKTQIHPFYDAGTQFNEPARTINYIPITQKDSDSLFDFDLISGKKFKVANLCSHYDPWGGNVKVKTPNFTLSIVPGAFSKKSDGNKNPLRLVVIHQDGKVPTKDLALNFFYRAKIIGSFILEECKLFPCRSRNDWVREFVLVGVHDKGPFDDEITEHKFEEIIMEEFITRSQWLESKIFLQAQLGAFVQANNVVFPKFKVVLEKGLDATLNSISENVEFINSSEMLKNRDQCRNLFDKHWTEVQEIKKLSSGARDRFKNFTLSLFGAEEKKKLQFCLETVRAYHVNDSQPDRFWFFQFLRAAMLLDRHDFYYNCPRKTWYQSPKDGDSKPLYTTEKEVSKCRSKEAEILYESAINGMGLMQNQLGTTYQFVEYDTQSGGSHQKIYSWLPDSTKRLSCEKENIELEVGFPSDVNWKYLSN